MPFEKFSAWEIVRGEEPPPKKNNQKQQLQNNPNQKPNNKTKQKPKHHYKDKNHRCTYDPYRTGTGLLRLGNGFLINGHKSLSHRVA